MTLYLKYRPQTINQLDLESVRDELTKIVKSGNIPHAFLFAGPKGTGKTSAARVMAKVVNCERRKKGQVEPCNKCTQCVSITKGENIDVIELDAASHRGIDDVRALRDAVKLAPASAKRKVYIIDEAHMLTTEACNALLKTLEEPPEHVMFILATTNPEKLIETIRSRTTLIQFHKAKNKEIVRSLRKKVEGEKIKVDEGVLESIAKAADASFRDADKILEQLSLSGKVGKEDVEKYLFNLGTFDEDEFIGTLADGDTKKALSIVDDLIASGGSVKSMLERVIGRLRSALLFRVGVGGEEIKVFEKDEIIKLIKLLSYALSDIPTSYLEQIPVEIAIIEWCDAHKDESEEKRGNGDIGGGGRKSKKDSKSEKKANGKEDKSVNTESFQTAVVGGKIDEALWKKILSGVKPQNASTEALLRAARPLSFDEGTLTLEVFYSFHKEKLESNPHRDILENVSEVVLGSPVRVVCKQTKPPEKPNGEKDTSSSGGTAKPEDIVLTDTEDEDIIDAAKEIFGS